MSLLTLSRVRSRAREPSTSWSNAGQHEQLQRDAAESLSNVLALAVAKSGANFRLYDALRTLEEQESIFFDRYRRTGWGSKRNSSDRFYQGSVWRKVKGANAASRRAGIALRGAMPHRGAMIIDELLALEHRGWNSLCDGTGDDVYGRLLTADGVMVLAHGMVFDRATVIASLAEAPPWRRYEIRDARLIEIDTATAILVYTGIAFRDEDEQPFRALMASTYTRRDGQWRLALYQQTPIPSPSREDA